MSVEIDGIKGFEYQYLVTVYLALMKMSKQGVQLIVEKIDGEDIELIVNDGGNNIKIEIQVKSFGDDIDLMTLAKWLNHFEARKADSNLLTRIYHDESRRALFISNARCTDETKDFIVNQVASQAMLNVTKKKVNDFLKCIGGLEFTKSLLGVKRKGFCDKLKEVLKKDIDKMKNTLARVSILEQQSEVHILDQIYICLNKVYFIPQSQTKEVLLHLQEAVRKARDAHSDVIPSMTEIIKNKSPNSIFDEVIHIERTEEEQGMVVLDKTNTLLLTGLSFCGKTHVARRVAQQFQDKGYNIKIGQEVGDARRFLMESSVEDRMYLLEDPFGQTLLKYEATEIVSGLQDLISKLSKHRKIIVTSRIDIVKALFNSSDCNQWSICNNQWIDLTVHGEKILSDIWIKYSLDRKIDEEIVKKVSENILLTEEGKSLQPGQLRHLAFQGSESLRGKSDDELLRIAKVDAKGLGRSLIAKGSIMQKTLGLLSLGATTTKGIAEDEIKYILSGARERPGKTNRSDEIAIFLRGWKRKEKVVFPNYPKTNDLNEDIITALDYLEHYGYIRVSNGKYRFSHPTYYEAARLSLENLSTGIFRSISEMIDRGVACLQADTAINFAKQLLILYKLYQVDICKKEKMINIAETALYSIFPAVQDQAVVFFVNIFEELSLDMQKKIVAHLRSTDPEALVIQWEKGKPWSDGAEEQDWFNAVKWSGIEKPKKDEIHSIIGSFKIGESNISAEEAWGILAYMEKGEVDKDKIVLMRIMSFDEAFIRAKATMMLIENFLDKDDKIVAMLYDEKHPQVIFSIIKAYFNRWNRYHQNVRKSISSYLKNKGLSKSTLIIASKFFMDFGDPHSSGKEGWEDFTPDEKRAVWSLWAEVFPQVLRDLPTELIRINEAHFYNTADKSIEYIDSTEGVSIANAWYEWIVRCLETRLPDDFGLAVADFLMQVTKKDAAVRKDIFLKLLKQSDTAFLTVIISNVVNHWDLLNVEETELLLGVLISEREDVGWLQAVAITRAKVPDIILEKITGDVNCLNKSAECIVDLFSEELLTNCLKVYCGKPQSLWWLGYHHAIDNPWDELVYYIASDSEHQMFEYCLDELLSDVCNGTCEREHEVISIWEKLCAKGPKERTILAKLLRIKTIEICGSGAEKLWPILISESDECEIEEYVELLLPVVEAISLNHDWLHELFGKQFFLKYLLPRLVGDKRVYSLLVKVKGKEIPEIQRIITDQIQDIYEKEAPRLFGVHKIVASQLVVENSEVGKLVNVARKNTIDIGAQQKNDENNGTYTILDKWCSKHK